MKKFSRNDQVIDGELDDNQVMMHLERGKYFGMNHVGKRIWELIEQPKTMEEITQTLLSEFDVTICQCEKEVEAFLNRSVDFNIVLRNEIPV